MRCMAAVINAGIGAMTIGLQNAGFQVLAAYEADERAAAIYRKNLDASMCTDSMEQFRHRLPTMPEMIAAQCLDMDQRAQEATIHQMAECVGRVRPAVWLLLLDQRAMQNAYFIEAFPDVMREGYCVTWRLVDVGETIGFPVDESVLCVVGIAVELEDKELNFPCPREYRFDPLELLEEEQAVDDWYRQVDLTKLPDQSEFGQYLCWRGNRYVPAQYVRWNVVKPPLIHGREGIRRLTHREVAALKGLPRTYELDTRNKAWMYRTLMRTCNAELVRRIAEQLMQVLQENNVETDRTKLLHDLFRRYLRTLAVRRKTMMTSHLSVRKDAAGDLWFAKDDGTFLYFEVKYYSGRYAPIMRVREACMQLRRMKEEADPVLVVFNEVPIEMREECWADFGVVVWDVSNLLWQLRPFPMLLREFIACLSYAVDDIEPMQPVPDVLGYVEEIQEPEKPLTWSDKLRAIAPGREQATAYEQLCTEMLKYILGDSLTLWRTQQKSNDDLYRFDLCCKVKTGAQQDFFDTVMHYFNTKYIVFEFKNYKDPITQKEIYTTEKYLYEKALRKVAIVISRLGPDENAVWAAKGALRENGKLILCLQDSDLLQMADMKDGGERDPADHLGDMLDELLIHLEK